ncbi:MAG: glutamate--tRNA ligase [Patescibacteria group bacterium]
MPKTTTENVRVRFAPSPTGFLHIGGLRTALFNWLFAKKHKGTFILRIEDTDQQRYVEKSVEAITESLAWCGLHYDEGPGKEGDCGPYIQSQRLEIYRKYAKELVQNDKAYYCFCTTERLSELKAQQAAQKLAPRYDQHCRSLDSVEAEKRVQAGEPHVIRMKLPNEGTIVVDDLVRGQVEFSYRYLDDAVIMKTDGFPTYQLANVIDDHLMRISHVIRAEEWLPSTPKHVFLYQAFGWELPQFAHLPLILSPQGGKLSKRDGAVSTLEYRDMGYLPEAIVNFIALLGWNPKTEQEIFTMSELIEQFSLDKTNKSGGIFNLDKLNFINGRQIRLLDATELARRCRPYFEKSNWPSLEKAPLEKIVRLAQDRMVTLAEAVPLTKFIVELGDYDPAILIPKKSNQADTLKNLLLAKEMYAGAGEDNFVASELKELCINKIKALAIKTGDLLWPIRVALSGLKASPDVFEISEVLGKQESLRRLDLAIRKME